jgi:hypothetical protein
MDDLAEILISPEDIAAKVHELGQFVAAISCWSAC